MATAKSTRFGVIAAVLLAVPFARAYAGQQTDAYARELLFRALDFGKTVTLEGIVMRRSGWRDHGMMQLKVAQKGGNVMSTVLSPLPAQGVTKLDDGRTWVTYIPDESRMLIQPSPRYSVGLAMRKGAAAQNYRFVAEKSDMIAGRRSIAIIATPRSGDMPVRRFWVDSEFPYMLRMDTISDGQSVLELDTKAIKFNAALDDDTFRLSPVGEVRKIYLDPPTRFRDPDKVKDELRFSPAMPIGLPYGFVIQEPQLVGDHNERFVAIRLTDGLASATVYQWKKDMHNPVPCNDRKTVRESNGIKMRLVGDLPEVVLIKLLDAFVKEALKGLQALLGTSFDDSTFLPLQQAGATGSEPNSCVWIVVRS